MGLFISLSLSRSVSVSLLYALIVYDPGVGMEGKLSFTIRVNQSGDYPCTFMVRIHTLEKYHLLVYI